MRLINTRTRVFEEFIGQAVPQYAILSHTWEEEEVSYDDYVEGRCNRKGFMKIDMTCKLAAANNIDYAWVDTCCIDKRSSAELTEAINSMFAWYQRSKICYVYLSDLTDSAKPESEMAKCRWFTRGWTLQELIAPPVLQFYDSNWADCGYKSDRWKILVTITGISFDILMHKISVAEVCVAQKMSWAAGRQTSRIEDIAYCLLGLFNINMPLLYGEEDRAFRRLQEEIIRSTPDLSLFAWTNKDRYWSRSYCGILASSPAAFSEAGDMTIPPFSHFTGECSIGNNCIKVSSLMHLYGQPGVEGCCYILPLYCASQDKGLGVRLRKVENDTFLREDPFNLFEYYGSMTAYAKRERRLLLECPPVWESVGGVQRSVMKKIFTDENIEKLRSNVLEIAFDSHHISITQEWGCFDIEKQCFFTVSHHSPDLAAIQFLVTIPGSEKTKNPTNSAYHISCMLYAMSWATDRPDKMQYHLVNYNEHMNEITAIQASFHDMEHSPNELSWRLYRHNIPWTRNLSVQIPGTKKMAEVSVNHKVRDDISVRSGKITQLIISYQIKEPTSWRSST